MPPLAEVYARLDAGSPVTLGANDASKAVVVALLWRHTRRPALLIVPRETDAEAYIEQLRAWAGEAALHFPSHGELPYARETPAGESVWQRLAVLSRIALAGSGGTPPLIVASLEAVAERTAAPADLGRGPGTIELGQQLSLDAFALQLVEAGYSVESLVETAGEAARRGGLIDVFPPDRERPVRIEFFGSEVDSIREFDIESQRTTDRLERVQVGPAQEWFPSREELVQLAATIAASASASPTQRDELASLQRGELPAPDLYGPLASSQSILDHLKDDALVLVDERDAVMAAGADLDELAMERRDELASHDTLAADAPLPHASQQEIEATLGTRARRIDLARWATGNEPGSFRLPFAVADAYAGRLADAASDVGRQLRRGDRVMIVTSQAQRYSEVLAEAGIDAPVAETLTDTPSRGSVTLVQGTLAEGWQVASKDGVISLTTDRELFGFVKQRRRLRRKTSHRSRFLAEVQPGDFVVHADHGIARFAGIARRDVDGEARDYLELRYAGGDRLYVPIDHVDKVTRYVGPSEHTPRMTRLGTQEWTRARARVREAVSIVAAELVRLYAARQLMEGHAFHADSEWQRELEAAFPYEETPDQMQAILDVKSDMESPRPMDRVICGDVGFGKTEVALRAAFKAVTEGYQVAVLVPTTVLAQQHERTFRERLAAFPTRIEVLSRFRTDAEARDVLAGLRSGGVDIVIGTHRLLYPGVAFHNLGLVIIDEEQRFGVTHKERLKRMRLEVDVLTLSATPIPRTLHMALTGIRDMSTMDDPPEGRQAVHTYVTEWDDAIAREAILFELERGGQVYLVHNRVHTIDDFAERLRALVPGARIVVGHGQMPEGLLKRVMERFADGEFDVLVCTTIIESGLDIPNVNTMIIDQADKLGLAQLYQLRGRVGRSLQQAYAYLFHPRNRILSEVAQQRLSTIFEASELGAGYQVALRDLEIRGAGNLLGAQQSGQIAAVGFDLYTKMLADAVESMKAAHEGREPEVVAPEQRGAVDLPVSAFIPESYIEGIEGRLSLYQRIAGVSSVDEADTLASETADRFGELPEALVQLFTLVRIRLRAARAGVASVRAADGEVVLTATDGKPFDQRSLPVLPAGVRIGRTQLRAGERELGDHWLEAIEALLRLLAGERALVPA
ncbi:MAG: transcription-repair coupling factor [Dehalococcoidia bacterium]|nr:transcription-repair coupling factor [Dehalococcoidia bacterium]